MLTEITLIDETIFPLVKQLSKGIPLLRVGEYPYLELKTKSKINRIWQLTSI